MRIVIDENLPIAFLSNLLSEFDVTSVKDAGWAGVKNGELLNRIEGGYDLFLPRIRTCATSRTSPTVHLPL